MITLALESTAAIGSVAVTRDGARLFSAQCENGLTHSEHLLPMALHALKTSALGVDDVDVFACTAGPGSFTGVRIAVSVLKGLAAGREKPCVGVSTLHSLARNLYPLDGIICPVMDARREQVYTALFTVREGKLIRLTEDSALSLADLAEKLKTYGETPIRLCGDGYALCVDYLEKNGIDTVETPLILRGQNAFSTALCAEEAALRGETVTDTELLPFYLREPQAVREKKEKEGLL